MIVILEACTSGTAIQDPEALNPDAANAAVVRAFRDADQPLALQGKTIVFTPEGEPKEGSVSRMGALRQSKFHVLTSSGHMESSYGYTGSDFPHTLFTYGLTLGVGHIGPMPCDTNGDWQAYPANSDFALFYRNNP